MPKKLKKAKKLKPRPSRIYKDAKGFYFKVSGKKVRLKGVDLKTPVGIVNKIVNKITFPEKKTKKRKGVSQPRQPVRIPYQPPIVINPYVNPNFGLMRGDLDELRKAISKLSELKKAEEIEELEKQVESERENVFNTPVKKKFIPEVENKLPKIDFLTPPSNMKNIKNINDYESHADVEEKSQPPSEVEEDARSLEEKSPPPEYKQTILYDENLIPYIESAMETFEDENKNRRSNRIIIIPTNDNEDGAIHIFAKRSTLASRGIDDGSNTMSEYAKTQLKDLIRNYNKNNNFNIDTKLVDRADSYIVMSTSKLKKGTGLPGLKKMNVGLYDNEIQKIMRPFSSFAGVVMKDEIADMFSSMLTTGKEKFGFILNTDPSSKAGEHWQACYCDLKDDKSLEFYDSYGDNPSAWFVNHAKKFIDDIGLPYMLKFKINKIRHQTKDSNRCGYHCMRFLINRMSGRDFSHSTDFNKLAESDASMMETNFKNFGFI